ncbi:MAG: biopolymer transporter ExbD [Pirellulaceae bacterium]
MQAAATAKVMTAKEEREIDIQLPVSDEAKPLTLAAELVIHVKRDGTYEVNSQETCEGRLEELLGQRNSDEPVLIRGDASTELRHVANVIGMCIRAGIVHYRLASIEE